MKKVNVLLSAYNGEKYINEQIDSILNQTWKNITLYVRDDGSTDGTMDILKDYESKGQIVLIEGKNVGFIESFFDLMLYCGDADYYAFADQDDYWLPEKIGNAIEMMNLEDNEKPLLYFSNYDFCNSDLKFVSHSSPVGHKVETSFANSLVDCTPLGFNMVFNDAARKCVISRKPKYSCGHDWWMYMVCQGLGTVIYDDRVSVKYRRHGNNVSIGGKGFISSLKWRFNKFFVNNYFASVRKMIREFAYYYQYDLKPEDRKILVLLAQKKYNPLIAIRKAFYFTRFRRNIADEIFVRIIFLLGKM